MCRNMDDPFLAQDNLFGENSLGAAAESRLEDCVGQFTGEPALYEAAGHAIAHLDARDAFADGRDLADRRPRAV